MKKTPIKAQMKVKDNLVSVIRVRNVDYISLTDLARYKNPIEPKDVIKNWLRAKTNIEFLALWEQMHNPNLKGVEIDTFKSEAGTHYFTMSPQRWIKETNAIGIISKSGNNGETYFKCCIIWNDCKGMERQKSYFRWEYARLCKYSSTCNFSKS